MITHSNAKEVLFFSIAWDHEEEYQVSSSSIWLTLVKHSTIVVESFMESA